MANEQPSCNCCFSSQQSVYMAPNAKKCKSWLNTIKDFVLFSNLFPVSEKIPLFLSLNKIHGISTCKLIYMLFHLHITSILFYLTPNRMWNFVTKIFCYWSFPIITGHGIKFETLRLAQVKFFHSSNQL